MTQPLTCQELVELVTDYFEGALSPDDSRRFEEHIDVCPGCSTYVEQMRETVSLTGRLREDDVAPPARDALLAQFRNWKERPA